MKKLNLLGPPRIWYNRMNIGGNRVNPRIRINLQNPDIQVLFDDKKSRRGLVSQLRKEVLPAVYALARFEGISIETSTVKPYFCHRTGGGSGFPGFVLYETTDRKLSGTIFIVDVGYKEEDGGE